MGVKENFKKKKKWSEIKLFKVQLDLEALNTKAAQVPLHPLEFVL